MELVIKSYPDGVVSSFVDGLKVGQSMELKGPINKIAYEPNMRKRIGMVAGGTGITPMLQVIKEIIKRPGEDSTEVHLLFANRSEEDILLKSTIDEITAKHSNIKVAYILSHPSATLTVDGFVTADLLKRTMPPPAPGKDSMIFVCGPPGFMADVSGEKTPSKEQGQLEGFLKELGYNGK